MGIGFPGEGLVSERAQKYLPELPWRPFSRLREFPRHWNQPKTTKLAPEREPSPEPSSIGLADELISNRGAKIVERGRSNTKVGDRQTAD